MPDLARNWSAFPDWAAAAFDGKDLSMRAVPGLTQTVVSGRIGPALAEFAPGAAEIGLWEIAAGNPYVVRLARDRALVVGDRPQQVRTGWRDGWAASTADDANLVIDLEGTGLARLVFEATSAPVEAGSPSAAALFAGVPAVLYRTAQLRARLHVETGFAPYVWQWLTTRSAPPTRL